MNHLLLTLVPPIVLWNILQTVAKARYTALGAAGSERKVSAVCRTVDDIR